MNQRWSVLICFVCLAALLVTMGCQVTATEKGGKVPITTDSDQARDLFVKGRDLQERLRFQESREPLEKAVQKDPEFAMAYLNLAFAQPSAKEFFATMKKATDLVDKVSEGERLWILGGQAGVDGKPTEQRKYYQQLVDKFPDDERAQSLLGNHYFGQQMYDEAIAHYEKAIAINSDYSASYNQLGYAYRFLGKYDMAEETFKKYIQLIPDDPNPYDSYAELLLKVGKYDRSIENYRKALQQNPNFVASHTGIATNYNLKGEYEAARKQLQTFYDSAKDDGQRRAALFGMTVSYVDQGNLEKALETLRQQHSIAEKFNDPANMAADLGAMGTVLLEFGKPDAALEKFNKSLAVMRASDLSQEQKELAEQAHLFSVTRVAIAKGDLQKAKENSAEYRGQAETRNNRFQVWNAHLLAGLIALSEKNFETAVAELEQTNQQNSHNMYRLALAYKGNGDTRKAEKLMQEAADYNALNSLPHAFMRNDSKNMMSSKYN